MGLDTSHNCWHGSYSNFHYFRKSLAKQIGLNLEDFSGYRKENEDFSGYRKENGKDLNSIDHDIRPLLNHSDYDGELSVNECEQIVKGLNNIIDNFDKNLEKDWRYIIDKAKQFRNGCLDAISKNEKVDFH